MTLGEKLKAARLQAGLSQRQLCGDMITRNMLSQIENGSATPSMATLQYLAGQLGKSVSYFLQEDAVDSPNPALMQQAREAYGKRQYAQVLQLLQHYQGPDPLFDQEQKYLAALCALAQASARLEQDVSASVILLEQMPRDSIYYRRDMEQSRVQLLAKAYPLLETYYKEQKYFENAYLCACKLRELPHIF